MKRGVTVGTRTGVLCRCTYHGCLPPWWLVLLRSVMKMRRGLESWVGETCLQGLALNRGKREACMGPELCVPEGCRGGAELREENGAQELEKGRFLETITESNKRSLIYYRFELFRFVASTGERVYRAIRDRISIRVSERPSLSAALSLLRLDSCKAWLSSLTSPETEAQGFGKSHGLELSPGIIRHQQAPLACPES